MPDARQYELRTYSSLIYHLRCSEREASIRIVDRLRAGAFDGVLVTNERSKILSEDENEFPWENVVNDFDSADIEGFGTTEGPRRDYSIRHDAALYSFEHAECAEPSAQNAPRSSESRHPQTVVRHDI